MFLEELEAVWDQDESLLVGSFNPVTNQLVYERADELIIKPARQQTMVEIAQADGWWDAPVADGEQSNGVSLLLTPGHDMYYRTGRVGQSPTIDWQYGGQSVDRGYAKHKASTLVTSDTGLAVKMMSRVSAGVLAEKPLTPFVTALGIRPEQVHPFCELFGYWLGEGSLRLREGEDQDAIEFSVAKPHNVEWMLETFERLGLVEGATGFRRCSGPVGSVGEHKLCITEPRWVAFFQEEYRQKSASGNPAPVRATPVEERATGARAAAHSSAANVGPEVLADPGPVSTAMSSHMKSKSAKYFASWVWTLPMEPLRHMLSGLRRAAGSEASGANFIYTSSSGFRDDLVRVCLNAGYAPRFKAMHEADAVRGILWTGSPIVARHAKWCVAYADGGQYGEPVIRPNRDVKEVAYSGRTWCVRVPHTFIVARRAVTDVNGCVSQASVPIIMGNCMIAHGVAHVLKVWQLSDRRVCHSLFFCRSG